MEDRRTSVATWAGSGAMSLTGRSDGPPLFPHTTAGAAAREAAMLFDLDARVLSERAAYACWGRKGIASCGGAARLVRAHDGWVCLTLARPEDVRYLDAFLGVQAISAAAAWPEVEAAVRLRTCKEVVDRAGLLGIACSAVGENRSEGDAAEPAPVSVDTDATLDETCLVVDLSALWAGPLAGHLLSRAGARVVKVEDARRPDGARRGPAGFFNLLNADKECLSVDFSSESDLNLLRLLISRARVVISSSRARAFHNLCIDPTEVASSSDQPTTWIAITGHGWASRRVGFGDDAAAAAGLVAWDPELGVPYFVADAIADPLCGLYAAVEACRMVITGESGFIDASLVAAAASVVSRVGPAAVAEEDDGVWRIDGHTVARPSIRRASRMAGSIGADNERLRAWLSS